MIAHQGHTPDRTRQMKPRRKFILKILLGLAITLFIAFELVARFAMGLGDPPLWILDPKIEYLARPNGEYMRFGNRVKYNAYSMRSDDFAPTKTDPREIRVMTIGDSVLNGGNLVDQDDIATEIARKALEKKLGRPVVIGNISAGSWGPRNQLEYIRRFGVFDADLVILVTHSSELDDEPTYDVELGVTRKMVDQKPLLALSEFFSRYLVEFFQQFLPKEGDPTLADIDPRTTFEFSTRPDMEAMDEAITESGADFEIILHPRGRELDGNEHPRLDAIIDFARERDIRLADLSSSYLFSLQIGNQIYELGDIHINELGQELLAKKLVEVVHSWAIRSEREAKEADPPRLPGE